MNLIECLPHTDMKTLANITKIKKNIVPIVFNVNFDIEHIQQYILL